MAQCHLDVSLWIQTERYRSSRAALPAQTGSAVTMSNSPEPSLLTAFVIGPIGDRLAPFGDADRRRFEEAEELWEYVIEPACTAVGLSDPIRADKISSPGEIPEQIFQLLRDADVVIADLTNANPNVMYELGLRHSREGKCTIQLGENQRLPFDVTTIRTIRFRRTSVGLSEVRDELIAALKACLEGRASDVTATRVWREAPATTASTIERARARAEDLEAVEPDFGDDFDDTPGDVEILAEGEAAMTSIGPTMERVTAAISEMGDLAVRFTQETQTSDARGGGFGGRMRIAQEFAAELLGPTEVLEEAAAEYVELLSQVDPAVDRILSALEADPDSTVELKEYVESLIALTRVTEGSMQAGLSLARVYGETGRMSKSIRPVTTRVQRALNRIAASSEVMTAWRLRAQQLPGWDEAAVQMRLSALEDESTSIDAQDASS